jgi:beta-fructofuranosidase
MFYRPEQSVAADVIPFYKDGKFQLFYLRDYRDKTAHGEGTPWFLLQTKDFVNFEEKGEVVSRGGISDQDLFIFTGCIYERDDKCYIFYTGHNPHFIEQGKNQEAIMMAYSVDSEHWTKVPDFCLFAPDYYEPHDFRDPFVFINPETKEYNMLLAARIKHGPSRRRGCTAVATSKDFINWHVKETAFYNPGHYYTHECPDLFQMGEWWYLVFSEFSDKFHTHYRMAKSVNGPWLTPENDSFDNRAFYAAKTFSDGERRYAFGWNPTCVNDKDYTSWMWGGNIVVHEIRQRQNGELIVKLPNTIKDAYITPLTVTESNVLGNMDKVNNGWLLGRIDGYSSVDLGEMANQCRVSLDLVLDNDIKEFALFLRSDKENERAYYIKIDTVMQRLVFDRWPRPQADEPFMLELERKIVIKRNERVHMDILVDGPVVEVYYDSQVVMSARMNDFANGSFGFATTYGNALIENFLYLI